MAEPGCLTVHPLPHARGCFDHLSLSDKSKTAKVALEQAIDGCLKKCSGSVLTAFRQRFGLPQQDIQHAVQKLGIATDIHCARPHRARRNGEPKDSILEKPMRASPPV